GAPASNAAAESSENHEQSKAAPAANSLEGFSKLSVGARPSYRKAGVDNKPTDHDLFMTLPSQKPHHNPHLLPVTHYAVDERLRRELVDEMHAESLVVESTLPARVHSYHAVSPLEAVPAGISGMSQQCVVKAQSINDGKQYCLRRVPGFRAKDDSSLHIIDKWKDIDHPNVVRVREAFTTRAFGDSSLIVVYDFKAMAMSLKRRIIDQQEIVSEARLWRVVLQITSALKAIHSAGLSARMLNAATVLITPEDRVYLNSCGLADLLMPETGYIIDVAQQEDLRAIGQILGLILGMNPENIAGIQGQTPAILPGASFSADFKQLFAYLHGRMTPVIAIDDVLRLAGPRMFAELDSARREADLYRTSLARETANGRIARLLCKLNFITERPEHIMDPEWSETGDRYLIKLFRDYVFHLVDDASRPVLDMAHVVGNLNKLDAGSSEKIMLMSRDGQSCLVVTYSEIKRCVDAAYGDLTVAARARK
ncbi:PAB-dependent poly(A)-specific ribonuclease subunit 3, partial [Linderina macrospora]